MLTRQIFWDVYTGYTTDQFCYTFLAHSRHIKSYIEKSPHSRAFLVLERMNMNGISIHAGAEKDGAQSVRILLVGHDTTLLMSLGSQFEQQLYKGNDLIYVYIRTCFYEYFLFLIYLIF